MTLVSSSQELMKGCGERFLTTGRLGFICGKSTADDEPILCPICKARISERLKVLDEWINYEKFKFREHEMSTELLNEHRDKIKEISAAQDILRGKVC